MANIQLTMDFLCQGYGWSETWVKDSGSVSLKAFNTAEAEPLLAKRSAMLGYEATCIAMTSSFVDTKGDSYLVYTGQITGGLGADIHCTSPHEGIYTVIRTTDAKRRRGNWLRGVPDDLILNGGIFDPGYAPWVTPATTFMEAIRTGGWGWMGQIKSATTYTVTSYTQDPVTNYVTCTVAGNPFMGIPVDTPVRVRVLFKKLPSKLNGSYTVTVKGAGSFETLTPLAVFPFTKTGLLWTYTPQFYGCDNWSFQKAGERRAGRPKLHTPGHGRAGPKG